MCSFTETLTQQDGDFSDPSYAWTGSAAAPASVTIGDNTTAAVTITNSYARETGQLVIAKVVTGDGYVGGTAENFTVRYDCGVAAGHRDAGRRRQQGGHGARPDQLRGAGTPAGRRPVVTGFRVGNPDLVAGAAGDGAGERVGDPHRHQPDGCRSSAG